MDTEDITVRDGRVVSVHHVAVAGAGARTVVLCHAAPGSGAFDPDPAVTARREVNLITVDRPGYGGSTATGDTWATVASAADDIAEVIDARGGAPVRVGGWSAGGRVALALAARRPDLVDRVVVLATPAPDEAVPWIPPPQQAMIEALRGQPPAAVHEQMSAAFASMVPAGDPLEALPLVGVTGEDDAVLAGPGVRDRLAGMLAGAFAQGAAGMVHDVAGYTLQPWGFEPAGVAAKTLLLYGGRDPIGGRHGRWWQRQLPDARLEMVPDAGHLLVIPVWERALSHLAPRR